MEQNLRFSGHETFVCKQFWLKKGFDFVSQDKKFSSDDAVSELGVGKNMVTAINYWVKSFGIVNDELKATKLGEYLFGQSAKDEFLEDTASIWLLHHSIMTKAKASIYNLVFNEFVRERIEFTREQLHNFLKRKCYEVSNNLYNENTITKDINIFLRNYLRPKKSEGKFEIEDDFNALLLDLELITSKRIDKTDTYSIEIKEREQIPFEIILYAILDNFTERSISFNSLLLDNNSPGRVFCLNREGLFNKIEEITKIYQSITFTQTAGNEVLQISKNLNKWEVLDGYYK